MQNEPLKSLSGSGLPLQNNCPSVDVLQNESANSQQQRHGTSTLLQKPRQAFVRPLIVDETKNFMDGVEQEDEDDSDSEFHDDRHGPQVGPNGQPIRIKKTRGRVKIKMEFIQNKLRRYTTFSKRKTGIMKKAYELSTLTGTQVMLLVASETGHVYTFATRKLQPMITSESGKALIQTCLNSPDPTPQHLQVVSSQASQETSSPVPGTLPTHQRMSQHGYQETDLQYSITEEGMKEGQVVTAPGSMRYVLAGQTFPMSNEVAQPSHSHHAKPSSAAVTYAVQPVGGGSSITTFFAPGVVENITSNIQLHAQPVAATESPQILTGKLQLHRIHPQNIILTGNAPAVQGSHIILNSSPAVVSSSAIPIVIAENPQSGVGSSSVRQRRSSNSAISVGPQDLVTLINSAEHIVGHQPQVHVVYNPVSAASGGLIFASNSSCQAAPATTHSLSVTQAKATEGLSLQHTPVIRTSGNEFQQDGGSAQRHATGDTIIIKASGNPARSSRK